MASSKVKIWWCMTFGGTWKTKDGWVYNHPGKVWNFIDLFCYRLHKLVILKWYSLQIFYYKKRYGK